MIDPRGTASLDSGIEPRVRLGAIVWMLAVQFFVAQIVVRSAWVAPFSLRQNFISDLGNTTCGPYPPHSGTYVCSPWHTWMNASFIVLGVIIVVGAALVRTAFPSRLARAAGLVLLSLAGVGIIAVGLFPENVNITYHKVGAAAHFILGNLGMVALGIAWGQARRRPVLAVYSIVSGVVGLVATALLVSGHYVSMGIGGMERLAAYPLPLWLMGAGISLTRVSGPPPRSYPGRGQANYPTYWIKTTLRTMAACWVWALMKYMPAADRLPRESRASQDTVCHPGC